MIREARASAVLLVLLSVGLTVACTPAPADVATPTASSTPDRSKSAIPSAPSPQAEPAENIQADYDAAVAAFPLPLPPGAKFPSNSPDNRGIAQFRTQSGEKVAYLVWRCFVIQAAQKAQAESDFQSRDRLTEQLQSVGDDVLPGQSDWLRSILAPPIPGAASKFNGAVAGEASTCDSWLVDATVN